MNLRAFVLLAVCLFLIPAAHAQFPAAAHNVSASIEAETATPAPGDTLTIAIIMDPKPGWHDYWLNPGDAGTPLELEWQLPAGITAGPVRAPAPDTLIVSGFMNHIYKKKHAFLIDLKIAPALQPRQKIDLKVNARWSACSDLVCVPEGETLSVPVTVGDGAITSKSRARFDQWRAALPVPLDREARYTINRNRIAIAVPYPQSADARQVWFFPITENIFRYASQQSARRDGDWLIVTGEVSNAFDGQIDGLLRVNDAQGLEVRALPGNVPTGGEMVSTLRQSGRSVEPQTTMNFSLVLGLSILGGLLLNLMPCVFPILGLKALSLAKMGSDESGARGDALAYSAGIILSCIALGGLLLTLRAGGEEIGWAFQLQEPGFVLLLLLLMVAVTANLAGLFEIGAIDVGDKLTRKDGVAGSFWTGVLAALVATPCTGPFMAAALGGALLLPVAQALLLFAGLGFGLALPFLIIAYVPTARQMLPRPGPWLVTFRKAMAVPMGLTALALLWLLWRLIGPTGLLIGIAASILVGVALVVWGQTKQRRGALALILAAITGVSLAAAVMLPPVTQDTSAASALSGESFSQARLAELRAARRNVFVYFTADWCVTCKVNEAAAIDREATTKAFEQADIVTLKGDYTRADPAITRFLAQHGRSGVPLYLYYPAGGEPQILPQILTVDTLTKLAK